MNNHILGIDVGGSGIKGALVDIAGGELATERVRIPTPESFTMEEVSEVIGRIAAEFNYKDSAIGVGFPAAVRQGEVLTPPTALHYPGWVGKSAADAFGAATGCKVAVLNDADVAGVAEIRFGAGRGVRGTTLMFTLGTGVGSALFHNGRLVPNTELGKLYLKGHKEVAELYMAGRIKEEQNLKYKEWGPRVNEYLQYAEWLFSPSLFILGGGISKKFHKFESHIDVKANVVPAEMRNEAGIIGAAAAAAAGIGG